MAIWDQNLKIGPCTTLIKVNVKVIDTYGDIAPSTKQLNGNIKCGFLNTRMEHRTNVRFETQKSWKFLTTPKVEVYTRTDKGFVRLGIL